MILALAIISSSSKTTVASVGQGGTYQSITTAPSQTNTSYKQSTIIQSIPGTLGSVIITGAGAGSFTLYDATTSNVNLRAGATSTLSVLANFPNSASAGTYTFDENVINGIVVEFVGAQGTSTITYRSY